METVNRLRTLFSSGETAQKRNAEINADSMAAAAGETPHQSDGNHSDNELLVVIGSNLLPMEETGSNSLAQSSSTEQIQNDSVVYSSNSESTMNADVVNSVYCDPVPPQDDKGHDILIRFDKDECNTEEEDTCEVEEMAEQENALHDCTRSSDVDEFSQAALGTPDEPSLTYTKFKNINGDVKEVESENNVVLDTTAVDKQQQPAVVGILDDSSTPNSSPVLSSRVERQRTAAQLMLPEATRGQVCEIFTSVTSGKLSPMWENNPWVDYLVFLTAVIPKDECISQVEALVKFFTENDANGLSSVLSEQQISLSQKDQNVEDTTDQSTTLFQKDEIDTVLRLLRDFYCHVLTKVPGRTDDDTKAREQAAIVTAVYLCILSDYRKLALASTESLTTHESVDATAAFFLACMPAKERNSLLLSAQSSNSKTGSATLAAAATVKFGPHQSFNDICEPLTEDTYLSPNTKASLSPESPADHSSSSGSNMVNHVGSLIRKKLHLDSKSSKHIDSADIPNRVRSPLKRFAKSSSSSNSKHKTVDSPPKQPIEVSEGDDYSVCIHREMLGLTVENVLERTIIRTVLPNGAAKKSGARVGSLIVKVGGVQTYPLTHFETIDELRRSNRPLKLDLRMISADALKEARGEMGRLIRGGEFGREMHVKAHMEERDTNHIAKTLNGEEDTEKTVSTVDEHSESYDAMTSATTNNFEKSMNNLRSKSGIWKLISHRWNMPLQSVAAEMRLSKKDKAISKAGEKLVALVTLFLMGIDYEVYQHASSTSDDTHAHPVENTGKTVAKILFEYVSKHVQIVSEKNRTIERCKVGGGTGFPNIVNVDSPQKPAPPPPQLQQPTVTVNSPPSRQRSKTGKKSSKHPTLNPNTTAAGVPLATILAQSLNENQQRSPLWQIGDVLHRARSFLADYTLKSALVIQTQLIALLCDILDLDSEMELSQFDEESHSYTAMETISSEAHEKQKGGIQGDLGCAGSLLKLIIRNSAEAGAQGGNNKDKPGGKGGNVFLAVVHRLAASRSPPARITACSLGPVLWNHLDFPHTLQLRGVITRSLHDVDVNVRRSTAVVLHETAELVFDPRSVPWLVLMCERAMTDPEPQLRAAAMTLTWHLAEHLPDAFIGDARKGSRSKSRLPARSDSTFAEVYLLQCKLLPVATRLAEDRAASVRLAVAAQCDRLCAALGDHWFAVIIDLLQALLGDPDERVRSEAVLCLPRLAENVLTSAVEQNAKRGVSVLESLLPHMQKLAKDPSSSVRAALATSSGELLTLLVGLSVVTELDERTQNKNSEFKEHLRHVDEMLIPLAQQLLNDKDVEVTSAALRAVTNASRGDVKELRSRLPGRKNSVSLLQLNSSRDLDLPQSPKAGRIENQPVVVPVLSEHQILRLLPTLTDLSNSPLWRVRQSAVEVVPALLGCTQQLPTRTAIAQLCVTLMGDSVDAVRKTAAECLCLGGGSLGGNGGGEWLHEIVLPVVDKCRQSELSKQRLLCLKMIEVLIKKQVCAYSEARSSSSRSLTSSPENSSLRDLLEMASSLSGDKTVNVRLNVGRILGDVVDECSSSQENIKFIIRSLEELLDSESSRTGGGDRDVLYFTECSLSRAQSALDRATSVYLHSPSTPPRRRLALAEI